MASRKGEINRQKIIDAAGILFYQQGFNQTSFADVAAEAGIPKGNFYFYFKSKDELLRAVLEDRQRHFAALGVEWVETIPSPRQRLLAMVDVLLKDREMLTRFGCPIGSLAAELGKQQVEMREMVASILAGITYFAAAQFRLLGHDEAAADHLARELIARLQGAALMCYVFGDGRWAEEQGLAIRQWLDDQCVESPDDDS